MAKVGHKLLTPPIVEPLTLLDVRQQIGIVDSDDTSRDEVLSQRIISARRWAEEHMHRAIITQTWGCYLDQFPCDRGGEIQLVADLQSVSSITYVDTSGAVQTLASDQYYVDTVAHRVCPAYGVTWPSARCQPNAIVITYVCGYGLAGAVPEEIKDALKFIVGHWEGYQSGIESGYRITTIPYAVTQLLQPHVCLRGVF
jgi:uncharacterized phiE125 gp8 family phage protein